MVPAASPCLLGDAALIQNKMDGDVPVERTESVEPRTVNLLVRFGRHRRHPTIGHPFTVGDLGQLRFLLRQYGALSLVRSLALELRGLSFDTKLDLVAAVASELRHGLSEETIPGPPAKKEVAPVPSAYYAGPPLGYYDFVETEIRRSAEEEASLTSGQ